MGRLLLRLLLLLAIAAAPARARVLLDGAGATFPFPLYSKWVAEFSKRPPDIHINYQPIGSGAGIGQIIAGTVDFGATDGPMTEEQLATLLAPVLHLPTTLGAVVITDGTGQDAYPISSFTWLLVPARFADADKGKAKKEFPRVDVR
jgi:ABC-type phosphate transport system substrate-binding protein